jgi:hypothetical protein
MFLIEIGPALGIVTAILTELFKKFSWFDTKRKKQWLAFIVSIIVVAVTAYQQGEMIGVDPIEVISLFGATLATAYAVYKGTKYLWK